MKTPKLSLEYIKSLGKEKSDDNLRLLKEMYDGDFDVELKREIVSSIGRQSNFDAVYEFIVEHVFDDKTLMEYVYQMFRTCLYKGAKDIRFAELGRRILDFYRNETLDKMDEYYRYKQNRKEPIKNKIDGPILLEGDAEKMLGALPDNCIQLAFTSPPYYNARAYSEKRLYNSYSDYLQKMKRVFVQCNRVIEDGRFLIVNVSPVITKRPGREFESIRYPIHFDFHKILEEAGFYFIDEIIWIKPEPSVKNRVGGYLQSHKALGYKPNCITESIMVYRKKCPFLLDKNINEYADYERFDDEDTDTSNCWYIAPRSDKNHPAVFPEELCRRILKYYSFAGDAVLDPFAGVGTFGEVAYKMNRVPVLCEIEPHFTQLISNGEIKYDVRKGNNR